MQKAKFLMITLIVLIATAIVFSSVVYARQTANGGKNKASCQNDQEYLFRQTIGYGNDGPNFGNTNINDSACCQDNFAHGVYNGVCYVQRPGNNAITVNGEKLLLVNPPDSLGYKETYGFWWIDMDYGNCSGGGNFNKIDDYGCLLCRAFNYRWVSAGESGVGEYDSSNDTECCGDDRNEYFKTGTDNTSACCNSNSDYVSGGRCYAKNKLQNVR